MLAATYVIRKHLRATRERRDRRWSARAHGAALAAILVAFTGAGEAFAGDQPLPDPASIDDIGAALEQAAAQTGQTLQTAGSEATVVQPDAANVAIPTIEASPEAQTVVVQENAATAGAEAANDGETTQAAAQEQDAAQEQEMPAQAEPTQGDETATQGGQTAPQESSTTQAAGAQATTVQTQPVNVAIPIVVASPGASTLIVQENNASAVAQSGNTATTTQVAGQAQSAGAPAGGPSSGPPSPPKGGTGHGNAGIDQALDTVVQTGSSTWIWVWNWTWTWDWSAVELPPVPSIPSLPTMPPLPDWMPSGEEQASGRLPEQAGGRGGAGGRGASAALGGSLAAPAAPRYEHLPARAVSTGPGDDRRAADVSSIFVQDVARPAPGRLFLPPIGRHAAPGGSAGAGIAPLTLVVGAFLALALQLFSAAGLLGRRLALTSVGWRRQAYLTPLERPG